MKDSLPPPIIPAMPPGATYAEPTSSVSNQTQDADPPLTRRERLQTGWQLAKLRAKEYLTFDARALHRLASVAAGGIAAALLHLGKFRQMFAFLAKFHLHNYSKRLSARTERLVRSSIASRDPRWTSMLDEHVQNKERTSGTANFFNDPRRMLGTTALVLKSPEPGRKGVLALKYNHVLPLFAKFYDVQRVAEDYHLFLEPSWSGYCNLDVLAFTRLDEPVFVQAIEPYDVAFLRNISSNLTPVHCAANWWVDHRRLRPLPDIEKDFDVCMVAGWGEYKRHHRFFEAIAKLRREGRRLRVLLLGYPVGWAKTIVIRHAKYYGVSDQIQLLENVPYDDVNAQLNRAKIHVLWSRHEGFNRAIIESMFAGLPNLMREGFNYGHRYAYVNERTGRFASDESLPTALCEVVDNYRAFTPRQWVLENMTCQHATENLARGIASTLGDAEQAWSGQIAVKVNELHSMRYFDESLRPQFQADYAFILECLRPRYQPICQRS